jgi:hypothetical protein
MQRTRTSRATPRRNNAPVRPPRPATGIPDLLFALAMTGWTMGAVLTVASFVDSDISAGAAGVALARLFSAALAVCGLFAFLLGLVLLRNERGRVDHYVTPMIVGALIGMSEGALFLWPADRLLFAPFVLIVFAFRPVRRLVARAFRPARGYQR